MSLSTTHMHISTVTFDTSAVVTVLAFLSSQNYPSSLQETWEVVSEPKPICSSHIISSMIQLGCGTLLRDASQIERKTSTQHFSATSLPGTRRQRESRAGRTFLLNTQSTKVRATPGRRVGAASEHTGNCLCEREAPEDLRFTWKNIARILRQSFSSSVYRG